MRLVIVRHGETDWTLSGRCAGTTDVDLTADGRRQAASLRASLERLLHAYAERARPVEPGTVPVLADDARPPVQLHQVKGSTP